MKKKITEYEELKKIRLHEIKEILNTAIKLIQEDRQKFNTVKSFLLTDSFLLEDIKFLDEKSVPIIKDLQSIPTLVKELLSKSKTTRCRK